jgi:pyruvate formate lyase activating enzyme
MSEKLTRREFLRQGSLALLGAGLGSCAALPSLTEDTPAATDTATSQPVSTASEADSTGTTTPMATDSPGATMPTDEGPGAGFYEARYYVQLDGKKVQCQMCFRRCIVPQGGRGFCRNKVNRNGRYYTVVHSRPSALQIDPIEKEPCFHMWPGATIFCTGTASCNNRCKFCQNWHLSQRAFEEIDHIVISPENSVALAQEMECDAVSFTYNEPTVFFEHMFDVAREARQKGMGTLFHTNGGMNEEPLGALLEIMDAVTVDLKAFTSSFYREVSSSALEPVLRTLKQIRQADVHLEIVNLMIPTLNDDMGDVRRMCQWTSEALGEEVPLHFTRFHPAYKLTSLPPTPIETLENAAQIADEEGLQYVYVGNVPGHERNSTFCPACGERIIERMHFSVLSLDVVKGKCRFCGHGIPGVWR